ncbi:MAG TPA: PEP-CTERM sorting domain-containing protein [Gemmataceae bacterium]|nr:PEP-CTERM sorting domain-containing protein [Gemmataceae bacterium]
MTLRRLAFVVILLVVVLTPQRGEAGLIPWSYQWNAQPTVVNADPLSANQPPGGITLTPGAITISGGNQGVALGNANIVAVNLTAFTFSPTSEGSPYHFTNTPYHLGVTLTDVDSGKSGTLYFSGVFDGSFTAWKMSLDTRFTSAAQQSLILGNNRYSVSLTTFTPPDPPAQGGTGSISAAVNVQPVSAPEPSTLLLAGSGLAGVVFSWLRRRT